MWIRTLSYLFASLLWLVSQAAYAFSVKHDYNSRMRPYYGSNVYLTQQVHYASTQAVAGTTAAQSPGGVASSREGRFGGYALHTGMGLEHFRFLQTGLFYNHVQLSNVRSSLNELRGQEYGVEAKLVLSSPVANVILGGGMFLANATYSDGLQRAALRGSGSRAGVELAYQASSNVSLILSGASVVESFKDASGKADFSGVSAKSTRIGGGISLWL